MLEKYLKQLGVSSFEELNSEEKTTFREWELALQGRRITDDEVVAFLDVELDTAVSRLIVEDLSIEAQAIRKAEVKLIRLIKMFLQGPAVEKAFVERSINQLTNK